MAYKRVTRHTPRGLRMSRIAMGAYTDLAQKDCGSDQRFDPSYQFPGLPPGQCVNQAQYDSYHASQPASSSSSDSGSFWSNLAAGLASTLKPGSAQQPVIVQGGGGISTGTALAIGGGALLLVVLLTRK